MRHFEPLETHRTASAPISEQEYVSIIEDALALAKNVGICRNFEVLPGRMALAKEVGTVLRNERALGLRHSAPLWSPTSRPFLAHRSRLLAIDLPFLATGSWGRRGD